MAQFIQQSTGKLVLLENGGVHNRGRSPRLDRRDARIEASLEGQVVARMLHAENELLRKGLIMPDHVNWKEIVG